MKTAPVPRVRTSIAEAAVAEALEERNELLHAVHELLKEWTLYRFGIISADEMANSSIARLLAIAWRLG